MDIHVVVVYSPLRRLEAWWPAPGSGKFNDDGHRENHFHAALKKAQPIEEKEVEIFIAATVSDYAAV